MVVSIAEGERNVGGGRDIITTYSIMTDQPEWLKFWNRKGQINLTPRQVNKIEVRREATYWSSSLMFNLSSCVFTVGKVATTSFSIPVFSCRITKHQHNLSWFSACFNCSWFAQIKNTDWRNFNFNIYKLRSEDSAERLTFTSNGVAETWTDTRRFLSFRMYQQ